MRDVFFFFKQKTAYEMRAEAFPGEDPMTLKTPEQIADQIVKMTLPSYAVNGEIIMAVNPK